MDFLQSDVKKLYRKYLVPTLGSALVMSIYSTVDTIAVGQYAGEMGTAAIAVINPLYTVMYVLATLFSIGGSVRVGNALGKKDEKGALEYFTTAVFSCVALTCVAWALIVWRMEDVLRLFGANEEVMPSAWAYGRWVLWFLPVIVVPDFLGQFLRMDKDPRRALHAVLAGGCVNMVLDWYLVFVVDMGVSGAGLATVIGTAVQCVYMATHFFSRDNHLKIVPVRNPMKKLGEIVHTGTSSVTLDLGNVVVAILMNRMVLQYGGTSALGVYGVVNTITILFQALFSGVGQTIQPGVSVNYGAGKEDRVRLFYRLAVRTALWMGIGFTLCGEIFPRQILRLFMGDPGQEVLEMGAVIVRTCFLCFPFLGYNVLAIFYLQAVLQHRASLFTAMMRSYIMPLVLLGILPAALGALGVYLVFPVGESIVSLLVNQVVYKRIKE